MYLMKLIGGTTHKGWGRGNGEREGGRGDEKREQRERKKARKAEGRCLGKGKG